MGRVGGHQWDVTSCLGGKGQAPGATQHPGASWPGELGPLGAVLFLCGLIRRIHSLKLHPGCMLDPVRTRATHERAVSFTEKHL